MNDFEFYALYELNPVKNSIILLLLALAYYFIFKKPSFFSPMMMGTVAHAAACFCVVLMSLENQIDIIFTILFTVTEISYIFGYRLSGVILNLFQKHTYVRDSEPTFIIYYYIHFTLLFIVQIIVMYAVGIAAFKDVSRLTIFKDIGYLSWIYDGLLLSAAYIWFIKRYKINKSYTDFITLLFLFLALLLKGGKTDVIYILWGGYFVYEEYKLVAVKKNLIKISSAVAIMIILATAITIKTYNVDKNILNILWSRILAFGDVFYMGFDTNVVFSLGEIKALPYLFGPIYSVFAKLGVLDAQDKTIMGFELYKYHYNVFAEIGPNARHNYLGYILFGFYGSIVFSFLCGALLGISSSLYKFGNTMLKKYIYSITSMFSVFIMLDPTLFVGYMLKFSFVTIICYVIYLVVSLPFRSQVSTKVALSNKVGTL